jgi:hypothetical protein
MRDYVVARAVREVVGGDDEWGPSGMRGIFLDNVELSWEKKVDDVSVRGVPVEYAAEADFVADMVTLVAELNTALDAYGMETWGNIIEIPYTGDDWNALAPVMDGAMLEDFAHSWSGPLWPGRITDQFELVDEWTAAGNDVLLVSQGDDDREQFKFAFAAYLMVADGQHVYYRHATSDDYRAFWQYPEYEYDLGAPLGPRQQVDAGGDVVFERYFECGIVWVNLSDSWGEVDETC